MSDFPDLSNAFKNQGPAAAPFAQPPRQQYVPQYAPFGDAGAPAQAQPAQPVAPPAPAEPPTDWASVIGRSVAGIALVGAVAATAYFIHKGENGSMRANDDEDDEDDDDDDGDDDDGDGDVDEVAEAEAQMRATPRPSSAFAPNPRRRR